MGYKVDWYQEDLVVFVEFLGDLEIEDFPVLNKILLNHIEMSSRPLVHVLLDFKAVEQIPTSMAKIHKALSYLRHPRTGWSIMLTDNRFIRYVGYTITQVSKARFRDFSEETEALQFLEKMESGLKSTRQG